MTTSVWTTLICATPTRPSWAARIVSMASLSTTTRRVEDLWNSTPAWGFPWISSESGVSPIASPVINGALGQDVAGVGAYSMLEQASVYRCHCVSLGACRGPVARHRNRLPVQHQRRLRPIGVRHGSRAGRQLLRCLEPTALCSIPIRRRLPDRRIDMWIPPSTFSMSVPSGQTCSMLMELTSMRHLIWQAPWLREQPLSRTII